MAADPEAAEAMLRQADSDGREEWAPPLTEWSLMAELLAQIRDGQGDIVQAVLNTIPLEPGKPRPKVSAKPFPRPRTAFDDLQEKRRRQAQRDIIALFAPHSLTN